MRSNDSFNFPLGLIKYIVIVLPVDSVDIKHHVYLEGDEYKRYAKTRLL